MKAPIPSELSAARSRASAHRLLLRQNIVATKARLSPGELKRDVGEKVGAVVRGTKDGAARSVKQHPYALGIGAVAVVAYLLRKPITTVSPKVGHWLSDRYADARVRLGGKDNRPGWWNTDGLKRLFRNTGAPSPTHEPQGD